MRYPLLVTSFTQAHLCDTPFCNVSRDNCAIQARKSFAILLLQVSRDMKKYRCWASKATSCPNATFFFKNCLAPSHPLLAECARIARFSAVAAVIFTAPHTIVRFLEVPRFRDAETTIFKKIAFWRGYARFSCNQKSVVNCDFLCDENWQKKYSHKSGKKSHIPLDRKLLHYITLFS